MYVKNNAFIIFIFVVVLYHLVIFFFTCFLLNVILLICSIMADNEDFEKQLKLEELEKVKQENADITDPYTYTDPDGTVYEWDHEKQAWFPKVLNVYF